MCAFFLCFYFWLHWVFAAAHGLPLVVAGGGYSPIAVHRLLLVMDSCSTARRLEHLGSVVVAHRLICPTAYGIFLDQGLNPCPLHW